MQKLKLICYSIILLMLCNCSTHNHYYKSLRQNNEDKVEIFCTLTKKNWRFDGYISDTILIHSNSFKELKTPQVMSSGFKDAQKSFLITMRDNKFHNKIKDDTISIEYKKNGFWIEEKFIFINDDIIK